MMVAFDTQILIWALPFPVPKKTSPARQDVAELQRRARILVTDLAEKKFDILLSTIVIAEFLTPIEKKNHGAVLATLAKRFVCLPFDIRASAVAADLYNVNKHEYQGEAMRRAVLRADTMIVATAKVHGAKTFYSHEPKCRALAQRLGMEAKDLPTHAENFLNEM